MVRAAHPTRIAAVAEGLSPWVPDGARCAPYPERR